MNQSLAIHIQEGRARIGITQEELAKSLEITKAAVSKWECGQSMPDITLLPKLASLFQTSIDDLLGYAPVASPQQTSEAIAEVTSMMDDDPAGASVRALELAHLFWSDAMFVRQMAMLLYAQSLFSDTENGRSSLCVDPDFSKVIETLLRRVIQLDPQGESHEMDLQSLCMVLASTGREGEAIGLIGERIPKKPNTAAVTMAGIQMRAEDNAAARTTLKRQLLFSLLEATSCIQTLTGCAGIADLETLVVLAEGLQKPEHFSSLSPTLLVILHLELASKLAAQSDNVKALDELGMFASELETLCNVLRKPHNPSFFDEIRDLLWQSDDEDIIAAREQSAAHMRGSMMAHLTDDERFKAIAEKIAPVQPEENYR